MRIPNDIEAEKIVLGSLLTEKDAFDKVIDLISEDSFYNVKHKKIFKAVKSLRDRGVGVDVVSVMAEINKTDTADVILLSEISSIYVPHFYEHAQRLFDLQKRRKIIDIAQTALLKAQSENNDFVDIVSEIDDSIKNIYNTSPVENIATFRDAIQELVDQVTLNATDERPMTGFPTGFYEFDKRGGLQRTDLITIAAESSMGKTSLAMNMAKTAAKNGAKIAIFSMEMKMKQIAARMLASETGLKASDLLYKKLDAFEFDIMDKGIGKIHGLELYFDDRSSSNIDVILNSIRSMKSRFDIDGVVVDYIQMLTCTERGMNTEQQMAEAARRLKNIAKELDIFVIILSQLSKSMDNPEPSLARVRASGQIVDASDNVILIYRPEKYNRKYPEPFENRDTQGTAMIENAKGRNIGVFKFLCKFDGNTTQFYDDNISIANDIEPEEECPW